MTYTFLLLRRVQRELQRFPQEDYERVREAMRGLAHNPRPTGCLALTGRAGWRICVGDYRVIYEVDDVQQPSRFSTWVIGVTSIADRLQTLLPSTVYVLRTVVDIDREPPEVVTAYRSSKV